MKKRVAICLRGGISKESNGMASNMGDLYKEGKYIDYKKCYRTILKHIITPNAEYDFDFFCHCWNTDLENDISNLYKPKGKIFEDNSIYYDSLSKLIPENKEFSGISQALSLKKSIELKESYEDDNFKYDMCIVYRYDLFLWKDMLLSKYNMPDAIYTNHGDGNGDSYFIMQNSVSKEFKYLYDSASKGNIVKVHSWIKNYIVNYMKKQVITDDIVAGVHHELIRKIYEYSIHRGHLSIDNFLEY